jgi:hypothetical protein
MLKLNFTKAYDVVSWRFLFAIMRKVGIPEGFVAMEQLLFRDTSATVSFNGELMPSFPIQRGVRQGCPLAPYLFLLVAEWLHSATRDAVATGALSGILLPDGVTQQTLLQYANDTSFSLQAEEGNLQNVAFLLHDFGLASGLVYNPRKTVVYWFSPDRPPPWIVNFGCQVVVEKNLIKLLGTPFGLDLDVADVDEFLFQKIQKDLQYWSSIFLSLAARAIIVNSVLLSTTWYFIHL